MEQKDGSEHKAKTDEVLVELKGLLDSETPDVKKISKLMVKVETNFNGERDALLNVVTKEREANKEVQPKLVRLAELEKSEEERKKASMTEIELAQTKAKEAEDAKVKAEAEKTALQSQLKTDKLNNSITLRAITKNFADPKDVVKLADFSKINFTETAEPIEAEIDTALDELAKAKPYLVDVKKITNTKIGNSSPNAKVAGNTIDNGEKKPISQSVQPLIKV